MQQLISQLNESCRDRRFAGKTNLEAIVEALVGRALEGDIEAITVIFNRVEGKPGPTLPVENFCDDGIVDITLKIGDLGTANSSQPPSRAD